MDCNTVRLGISFCCTTEPRSMSISPKLALLLNGSTFKTSMKCKVFEALSLVEVGGDRNSKGVITRRIRSVDAMSVSFKTEEVVERLRCIKAPEVHKVVVCEDRGSERLQQRINEDKKPKQIESLQRKLQVSRTHPCISRGTRKNRKKLARGKIPAGRNYTPSEEEETRSANRP
ncbi:hypothetical protein EVAR_47495_1 [Eumeta japonica]|uniref:Uncharacterized protein n=1 Tax=Eumeta variegata TaxID=151549 RepID=A0A4C1XV26_EUMVA|nr:hypothetical protein EVAR_47495_1 [Eumeta japonica]